eukprot:360262-Chlamydomonas_euryale.AAC.14
MRRRGVWGIAGGRFTYACVQASVPPPVFRGLWDVRRRGAPAALCPRRHVVGDAWAVVAYGGCDRGGCPWRGQPLSWRSFLADGTARWISGRARSLRPGARDSPRRRLSIARKWQRACGVCRRATAGEAAARGGDVGSLAG